ncbi:HAMP domain-containing sensor histidine kinase [Aquipuribacter sp. MA13-6]|uniref:HAMP domain-containing sensor histidine kinase n=1 Tax=unclassified Aquipuribacter TaxID=2635084 RepID=UPI003EF02302
MRGEPGHGVDLRPLDPVRSIKVKLGLVVAASLAVGLLVAQLGPRALGVPVLWTLVLAMAVALLITHVLAHGMTSPLRQMTAAAREMAAGRPATEVATSSRDEVGELARAFTTMAREIAEADEQRQALLANVAHELRTPVAALRAELENLVDGVRVADDEALGDALVQVERMGLLLDDLLDLARTQGGAEQLDPADVDLGVLVSEVVAQVRSAHRHRPVDVDVPAGTRAWADEPRLRQVLTNLLDNACRHGGTDGRVRVSARPGPAAGAVVVEVQDDGPGIPAEHRSEVFERFRRGGAGLPGDGGTGLGLAIARWAVALHGGRIAVVPGEVGCRVRVELPGRVDA